MGTASNPCTASDTVDLAGPAAPHNSTAWHAEVAAPCQQQWLLVGGTLPTLRRHHPAHPVNYRNALLRPLVGWRDRWAYSAMKEPLQYYTSARTDPVG